MDKKAQLGWIEFKYMFFGFIVGVIIGALLFFLFARGILLPKLDFLCYAAKAVGGV